ncbi:hypothetical protein IAU60_002478 [Kwoniella sp. DSM 27419]
MPKQAPTCGNPVFLKWMEELRDAAKEKNLKSAESYTKACKSLQNCPITYNRPRELVVLQGIGEKTVAILEKKWKAWCEENGVVEESPSAESKGRSRANPADSEDEGTPSGTDASLPKKRKKAKPKAYIPARGSGPYGILLSLVLAVEDPEITIQAFLTKSEVIRGAQDHCDTSYEHSEKGTYFTAWSGMKTLVNKGYVYVTGNPHKYCLTEEGYEVAKTLSTLRSGVTDNDPGSKRGESSTPRLPTPPTATVQQSTPVAIHTPSRNGHTHRPERFQFWYIDSSGARVPSLTSAMIRLDPAEFINLRKIEFRTDQRSHPFTAQLRLIDDMAAATVRDTSGKASLFAFIVEGEAPPSCSTFDDVRALEGSTPKGVPSGSTAASHDETRLDKCASEEEQEEMVEMDTGSPIKAVTGLETSKPFGRTASAPAISLGQNPVANLATEAAMRRARAAIIQRSHSSAEAPLGATKEKRPAPRLSSHVPSPILRVHEEETGSLQSAVNLPDFTPGDAIIYPPGSYEIVLVIDTREVESRSNRDKIAETLSAKGVKVETRALRLGDMCWVAKRTEGDLGGEEDECVLDYVVERKRLDDLCSSIRDGRYAEQCFRLSNSCIGNVYYVVEDWQVAERMEYHGLQIMTAKSQIQVHNRFFLKETHKLAETIDFLTTMTRVIQSSHQDKALSVIPTRYLSRPTYAPLQTHLRATYPDTEYLISFQAYQEINDKSASVTLREKFARMLLCVKGMSAERVSAILDTWETPRDLWNSLKQREERGDNDDKATQAESKTKSSKKRKRGKEMMFADTVKGEGRRKIGDALSKELWRAFMGNSTVDEE